MKKRLKGLMALWIVIIMVGTMLLAVGGVVETMANPTTISAKVYTGKKPFKVESYSNQINTVGLESDKLSEISVELGTPLADQSDITDKLSDVQIVGWRVWSSNDGVNYEYEFTYEASGRISDGDATELYDNVILEPIYIGAYIYDGEGIKSEYVNGFGQTIYEEDINHYTVLDGEKSVGSQFPGTDGLAISEWKLWYGMVLGDCGYIYAKDFDDSDSVGTVVKSGNGDDKITASDFVGYTDVDGNQNETHFSNRWCGDILEFTYSAKYRLSKQPTSENSFTVETEVNSADGWEDNTNSADSNYQWYSINTYNVTEPAGAIYGLRLLRSTPILNKEAYAIIDGTYNSEAGVWESADSGYGEQCITVVVPINEGETIRMKVPAGTLADNVEIELYTEQADYLEAYEIEKSTIDSYDVYELKVNNPNVGYVVIYSSNDESFEVKIEIDELTKLNGQTKNYLDIDNVASGRYICKVTFSDSSLWTNSIDYVKPTAADFVFTEPDWLTYDGNKKEATVKPADGVVGMGAITIHYYDENGNEVTDGAGNPTAPTDAGTYTVKIDVDGGATYGPANGITSTDWKFTIDNASQTPPVLGVVHETISGKNDGKITGLTTDMKYRTSENESWRDITDVNMELADGTYYVYYPGKENYNASAVTTVVISEGRKLIVTYMAEGILVDTVEVEYNGTVVDANIPEIPSKIGYDKIAPVWDKEAKNVTEDMTVTAEYTINTYTVTFMDYDGTELKKVTVEYGGTATAPTEPIREGYAFVGWDKPFSIITADVTVTATYEIEIYIVIFKDYEGNVIDIQSVEYGSAVPTPEVPERDGYTFTGWDKDIDNITQDLTITAQYEIKTYTVTFKDYDGTELKKVTVEHGFDAPEPNEPEREGYTFIGWDKELENVTSNMTVTAVYTINTYKVTYVADGVTVKEVTVNHGASVATTDIPEIPAKEGCDKTAPVWDKEAKNVTSDMTVIAVYTINTYKVTYVADGVTVKEVTVSHGENVAVTDIPEIPTKTGYDKTAPVWDEDAQYVVSDMTVTAVYTINTYTVTFRDYNGSELKKETVNYGTPATAPVNPTREGYTFTGWDKAFDNITADTIITAEYTVIEEPTTEEPTTEEPTTEEPTTEEPTTEEPTTGEPTTEEPITEEPTTEEPDTEAPETGDKNNVAIWFILILVALAGGIIVYETKVKEVTGEQ